MKADEIRDKFFERGVGDFSDGSDTALIAAVAEVAAQLAELNQNLRDLHPELNQPEECRTQQCTYHKHYLVYGPADLTHEAFHEAEKQCGEWQKRLIAWYDAHRDDNAREPEELQRVCAQWEARVRA
jgi:hypothetical protein